MYTRPQVINILEQVRIQMEREGVVTSQHLNFLLAVCGAFRLTVKESKAVTNFDLSLVGDYADDKILYMLTQAL